jgi:hypothetical protein
MNSMQSTHGGSTTDLVMAVFDIPVTFHRSLVGVTGSVTAALMLSQAIAWTETLTPDEGGWFTKSQDDWADATGLSRWEQETARRVLRDADFMEERKSGLPAKLWFRVRQAQIWKALHAVSQSTAERRT